ncbi:hypothetical protein J5J86_03535 [Aquabacter sp. L1I39]|uniref:hypothetical protein n=1 Tax=Aquabacter sp. L1I39 TaxID=2820278 RepID=UPI001ADCCBBA|nr:hypothetical protein [Aquabacter sp. L1I39]QTL04427.1 hypothetical protein J5J86_03535 [Aquabacter sp. L1I39]
MIEFQSIDPILSRWAQDNQIVWLSEYKGYDVRTYFLNESSSEPIQVWVDPPSDGTVQIHVFQYKLGGKKKRSEEFSIPVSHLYETLNAALELAAAWKSSGVPASNFD